MAKIILYLWTVATVFMLATASLAEGAERKDFAGIWVLKLGERNLFVLSLTLEADGVKGTLERPQELSLTGAIFTNIAGASRADPIVKSHFANDVLHFTTQNADNAKDTDDFIMSVNEGQAELSFDVPPDIILEPFPLQREHSQVKVGSGWVPGRAYTTNDSDIENTEMKAIYDEDQRVRQAASIDWGTVSRTDADRREATTKLLVAGSLHTGKDYEKASFIFQHGDSASDYLLAHTLAMVAVSKGDAGAIWIASATLDRYLQKVGQKQVFGTQFIHDSKNVWTQEPYDRDLVSDALRRQLAVPAQIYQTRQLQVYQHQK